MSSDFKKHLCQCRNERKQLTRNCQINLIIIFSIFCVLALLVNLGVIGYSVSYCETIQSYPNYYIIKPCQSDYETFRSFEWKLQINKDSRKKDALLLAQETEYQDKVDQYHKIWRECLNFTANSLLDSMDGNTEMIVKLLLDGSTFIKEVMQLQIHNLIKGHFTLEYDKTDTVKDIKTKIRSRENIPITQQSLIYDGHKLNEDYRLLSYYGIEDGATIVFRISADIKISVEFLNDLIIFLEVNQDYSIANLKLIIEDKTSMDSKRQHLYLDGNELDNEKTVADYNIQNGACLLVRSPIQIRVKTLRRKVVVLDVKETDTVAFIKNEIRLIEGIPCKQQGLLYKAKELKNENTLADYGIGHDSKLDMFSKSNFSLSRNDMSITIITDNGKNFTFKVQGSDSIKNIKIMIQRHEGIPVRHQRLIHDGRQLEDGRNLADYGIKNKDKIHVALCLCDR